MTERQNQSEGQGCGEIRISDFGFRISARRGSALILTVVLTSLLAIVGVLFLLATRIDKMATSATSEGRELAFAVDTVLAEINEDLIEDVPGVTNNQEFYDYPDTANAWLAELEPYAANVARDANQTSYEYRWRKISNVGGVLAGHTQDVPIGVVGERDPVLMDRRDPNVVVVDPNAYADADGDGVGDAKWFRLPGDMSSRGRPIYAAIRIVDNGALLNVNTGYASGDVLDLLSMDTSTVDGSGLLQVNVLALATDPNTPFNLGAVTAAAGKLRAARTRYPPSAPEPNASNYYGLRAYEARATWRYLDILRVEADQPACIPFDSSDELELRYRFLLDHQGQSRTANTRIETWAKLTGIWVPREGPADLADWYPRVAADGLPGSTAGLDPKYSYRHVATTYNMDRLIMNLDPARNPVVAARLQQLLLPAPGKVPPKMLNVSKTNRYLLRDVIEAVLEEGTGLDMGAEATQITVNLLDYNDVDDEVTYMPGTTTSKFYGFERPCVYLSEIACRQVIDASRRLHTSYAVELFKPYFEDADPPSPRCPGDKWQLRIENRRDGRNDKYPVVWGGHGTRRFQVLLGEDDDAPFGAIAFNDPNDPWTGYDRRPVDVNDAQGKPLSFQPTDTIYLERWVRSAGDWLAVDHITSVPADLVVPDGQIRSIQRNIDDHKCVWRQWTPTAATGPSLGSRPPQAVTDSFPARSQLQAHPANKLTNIGELGMVFMRNAYSLPDGLSVPQVLVDLTNPVYAKLLDYLTVLDLPQPVIVDPNQPPEPETRIMGRVNINTAPSFVLAQLPWMRYPSIEFGDNSALQRARAVVARRIAVGPYRGIGELMQLPALRSLASDTVADLYTDTPRGPDLTRDNALDDFEERDLIFQRISNLVTVRSDVFTAYILVRIGEDGPQRRVVAVLDRSRVNKLDDRVRIVMQQLVPDPR